MGVEFKYPLSWGSPSVKGKTISFDHFGYQDNHIIVYPKNKEAFLCSDLEEYDFMCGGYVFTCDSKVDYFDCEQYYYKKTEGGYDYAGYDEDAIVNALNGRGLKCNKSEAQIRYDVYELPELIESQFRLLEKISKVTKIDGSLEKEIKSDFNLFEFC